MKTSELLSRQGIIPSLHAASKKLALQAVAEAGAKITGVDADAIFDALVERERLGCTGVGNGFSIPHGRFASLQHVYGVFARLSKPVDFDASDGKPVDLIFLLLAPEKGNNEHLKVLSRVARMFRDKNTVAQLRAAQTEGELYELIQKGMGPEI